MKQEGSWLPSLRLELTATACIMVFAFAVNFAQRALPWILNSPVSAVRAPAAPAWIIDLTPLKSGAYYLSAGRPTGPCDLLLDDRLVATTASAVGNRLQAISLGSSFTKGQHGPFKAEISCALQKGFSSGLTDAPAVLPYLIGRALQAYREFVSIWLGAFAGLFLLFSALTLAPPSWKESARPVLSWSNLAFHQKLKNPFVMFSVAAVLYGSSLSYVGWLVLPDYMATYCHIIVRLSFSLAFLRLGQSYLNRRRPFAWVYACLMLSYTAAMLIPQDGILSLVNLYKITHPIFGLSTLLLWRDLRVQGSLGRANALLARITLVWACAQLCDSLLWLLDSATYSAPVMLATITWCVGVVRHAEVELTYQLEHVVGRILELSANKLPLDSLVQKIAEAVSEKTHFKRLSVYIDGYCLGRTTQPHRVLLRVFEFGYLKTTDRDCEVSLEHGRGSVMLEAMRTGNIVFRQGTDKGWFCVVPIGSLAYINLSDDSEVRPQIASDSYAVIQRLQPAIALLEDKLLAANLQRNVFLQRIKAIRGFGSWPVELGVIRVDIEDSSSLTTKFQQMSGGRDVYGEFVDGKYIPALLKYLNGYADLEEQYGDELYLLVLPELGGMSGPLSECTANALRRFIEFTENEGAQLSIENGFEPVRWVGGATLGSATLTCDEFKVRTSGMPPNRVKRLQDAAISGSILVDETLIKYFPPEKYALGEYREFLIKKDRVAARPLFYRHAAKRSA